MPRKHTVLHPYPRYIVPDKRASGYSCTIQINSHDYCSVWCIYKHQPDALLSEGNRYFLVSFFCIKKNITPLWEWQTHLFFWQSPLYYTHFISFIHMTFGTIIPNLTINNEPAPYPVLNERAIRATAWLMMLIWFITFVIVFTTKDFTYLYPTVIAFWIQFAIAVIRGPTYAPFSILWRLMVHNQQPEYVWAIQKRFAWSLWLAMATAMIIVTAWFGITGITPFAICMTCLFFMWMESALGICVWCKIYYGLIHLWRIKKPTYRPACPGGACSIKRPAKKKQ